VNRGGTVCNGCAIDPYEGDNPLDATQRHLSIDGNTLVSASGEPPPPPPTTNPHNVEHTAPPASPNLEADGQNSAGSVSSYWRQARLEQPGVAGSAAQREEISDELRAAIILFWSSLDEQQRRLYAGLESLKLGRGGDRQIAEFLQLDPHTVAKGRRQLVAQDVAVDRVRKLGGGRKPVEEKHPK
jgi:hypothetical protein